MKRKEESMAAQQRKKKLGFRSKGFEEDSEDDFLPRSLFIYRWMRSYT